MNYTIKNWNEDDRPREKLLEKGKLALSNAELLAIIIGSGNREETAVDLAKKILASVDNNWNTLAKLSIEQLCRFKGIGTGQSYWHCYGLRNWKKKKCRSPSRETYT